MSDGDAGRSSGAAEYCRWIVASRAWRAWSWTVTLHCLKERYVWVRVSCQQTEQSICRVVLFKEMRWQGFTLEDSLLAICMQVGLVLRLVELLQQTNYLISSHAQNILVVFLISSETNNLLALATSGHSEVMLEEISSVKVCFAAQKGLFTYLNSQAMLLKQQQTVLRQSSQRYFHSVLPSLVPAPSFQ